jgi:quercetin dioxygenase-like cupin family protein
MKMSSESTQNSQLNQHRGQELLFILKGEVEVNVNGNTYILEKGDSIHFNSSYPHNGSCLSKDGAELIGIIYNEPDDPLFPSGARCP